MSPLVSWCCYTPGRFSEVYQLQPPPFLLSASPQTGAKTPSRSRPGRLQSWRADVNNSVISFLRLRHHSHLWAQSEPCRLHESACFDVQHIYSDKHGRRTQTPLSYQSSTFPPLSRETGETATIQDFIPKLQMHWMFLTEFLTERSLLCALRTETCAIFQQDLLQRSHNGFCKGHQVIYFYAVSINISIYVLNV